MTYKRGDVVLIKFPFTTLLKSKKRPDKKLVSVNDSLIEKIKKLFCNEI